MSTDKGLFVPSGKDFDMDISIKPGDYLPPQAPAAAAVQVAQHREVIQAARSINASGYFWSKPNRLCNGARGRIGLIHAFGGP